MLALERPNPHELLIDLRGRDAGTVVEEREQVAAHQHVLLERHRVKVGLALGKRAAWLMLPMLRNSDVGLRF